MVTFMLGVAIRAVVLLAVAWGAMLCLRRRSAALRAGLWTATFVALLTLPLLSALPALVALPVLPSRAVADTTLDRPQADRVLGRAASRPVTLSTVPTTPAT